MKYFHNMQDVTSDCGIAVVKSLLQYYNRYNDKSFESILSSRDINQGLSLFDIEESLANLELKEVVMR